MRKGTATTKLTISHDGRIGIKLKDGVSPEMEAWLKKFSEAIVADVMASPSWDGRSLRGVFRQTQKMDAVWISLSAGGDTVRKTFKTYGSDRVGLGNPPEAV